MRRVLYKLYYDLPDKGIDLLYRCLDLIVRIWGWNPEFENKAIDFVDN
jgi:hypothetical protein